MIIAVVVLLLVVESVVCVCVWGGGSLHCFPLLITANSYHYQITTRTIKRLLDDMDIDVERASVGLKHEAKHAMKVGEVVR